MTAEPRVTSSTPSPPSNAEVAVLLERVAILLAAQDASPYRQRAWQRAATTLRELERPVAGLLDAEGLAGLDALEGIGPSLAAAIAEIVRTGRLRYLARLEGELGDDALFTTIPGVGPTLAHRIAETLGVHTLEDLELAAHDGRLATVPGIGARRARAIRESLEVTLRATARRRAPPPESRPSVALLLAIDERYRTLALAARLPRIAPRRFNPSKAAWLPILHAEEEGWHFTALFSNTARAHSLGTSRDWVVLYAQRDGHEIQHTVVTETRGPLEGRRVVRGRERECAALLGL